MVEFWLISRSPGSLRQDLTSSIEVSLGPVVAGKRLNTMDEGTGRAGFHSWQHHKELGSRKTHSLDLAHVFSLMYVCMYLLFFSIIFDIILCIA